MQLEIITPEMKVFTGEVSAVQLPGIDGQFQVLNNHAPIISALEKGKIKVDLVQNFEADEKTSKLIELSSNTKVIHVEIKGGVVEMLNNKLIVLAE
ncbi:MAG: F0F1 ATP synthase subunit epsilon [Crocinitomicaceae bacterium]|nr:MAG: F0F1 ATP synthase subunit epsilon [Crocinitomicaceae bacterium]